MFTGQATNPYRFLLSVIVFVMLVTAACSREAPAPQNSAGLPVLDGAHPRALSDTVPGATADVAWRPGTVVLPVDEVNARLQRVSDDGHIFTFVDNDPRLSAIQPPTVLLLKGLALVVVKKVDHQAGQLTLTTRPAALVEAIQDGEIHWNTPVDMHQVMFNPMGLDSTGSGPIQTSPSTAPSTPEVPNSPSGTTNLPGPPTPTVPSVTGKPSIAPAVTGKLRMGNVEPVAAVFDQAAPARAGSGTSLAPAQAGSGTSSGDLGDYKYTSSFNVLPGHLEHTIDITRSSKVEMKVHINTLLLSMESTGDLSFHSGSLTQAKVVEKLRGKLSMNWAARTNVGADSAGQELLTLPAIAQIPLIIGGLPFVFGVGAKLIIGVALTSKYSTSEDALTLIFDGDEGFSGSTQGGFDATGQVSAQPTIGPGAGNRGVGVDGFFIAMASPRINFGIGVYGFSEAAYMEFKNTLYTVSKSLLSGMACTHQEMTTTAEVGVESQMLFSNPKVGGLEVDLPGFPTVKKALYNKVRSVDIPSNMKCS